MSPLYRGGDIFLYFSPLMCSSHQFCVCTFSPSIIQAVKNETLSQLLAYCLWRWANISPVLGYRVVFDATLNVGQRHRRRASINPALASSSSYCTTWAGAGPISIGLKVWRTNKRRQPNILATWRAGTQQALVLTNVGPLSTTLVQN